MSKKLPTQASLYKNCGERLNSEINLSPSISSCLDFSQTKFLNKEATVLDKCLLQVLIFRKIQLLYLKKKILTLQSLFSCHFGLIFRYTIYDISKNNSPEMLWKFAVLSNVSI